MATALAVGVLAWPAGAGALRFARHQQAAIAFPYPLDYGEGPILEQAVRLGRLQNIYASDLSIPPYRIAPYPPVHPLLLAPLTRLFGPAYWYGRVVASGGVLAAALSVALILRALSCDWVAALAGGTLLLSFPAIVDWSRLSRVDGLALGLSMTALVVVVRGGERPAMRLAAAALLTAAIYTRQSHALAAPLAALVWLLATGSRRGALELFALVGAASLMLFLALQAATGGGFFLNVVTANVNTFYWGRVWRFLGDLCAQAPWLMVGAIVFAFAGRPARTWWLVVPYLAGATLSTATIGKVGSNVNYLYELCAALSLCAGALLAWARAWPWRRVALLLLLAGQLWALNRWTVEHREEPLAARIAQREQVDRLSEVVRTAAGPVLADEFMGLLPLSGRDIYFQPFEFQMLEYAGAWSSEKLAHQIEDGKFAVILLYEPPGWDSPRELWAERLRSAIFRKYRRVTRAADAGVYRPVE